MLTNVFLLLKGNAFQDERYLIEISEKVLALRVMAQATQI
jgi:hypothetical protein